MLPYIYIVLPTYSVLAFLGSFAALTFLFFRLDDYDLTFKEFLTMFAIGGAGCLLGSKILFFLTMLPTVESVSPIDLAELFLTSGYVFYGGLFGTLTAVYIFSKRSNKDFNAIRQLIAPALPLFHGFGRIGCFMAGCCYGVTLEEPIILFDVLTIEVLPTQLIESVFEFMMFAVLCSLGRRYPTVDLLKVYLLSYAAFRFLIEFWRADPDRGLWFGVSTSQWISLLIIGYYLSKMLLRSRPR